MINKIQVVGGNSDIGFSVAKKFAENGYNIHLISKDFETLNEKKNYIMKNFKVKCEITQLDIQEKKQVEEFFNKTSDQINVIIIAVGYLEKDEINHEKIINLNYKSLVFYIEKALIKYNKDNTDLKTIIGISSIAGDRGKKKNNIYSSAKSGFSNYLDGLRQRLYKDNINIITVKPGYVRTKMTKNLKLPELLVTSVEKTGEIIFNSYLKKNKVVYVPGYWRYIMIVYKMIPEFIFKFLVKFIK